MDPVTAVLGCGGAARYAQLKDRVVRRRLVDAVAAGELRQPRRGLYAVPDCPPDILAAAGLNGVRSCATAAVALGLDVIGAPSRPHITVPRGSAAARWPGAEVHRRDVVDLDGCTDVLTTSLDCLACLPRRFALVPLDSALRQGRISEEDLHLAAKRMNSNDLRRRLLCLADPESGSPLETVARVDLHDEGYSFRTQHLSEPAGWVDFLVEERIVVEADGFAFHSSPEAFELDRWRDGELSAQGLPVLRFSYRQIVDDREWWLGVLRDALTFRSGR